MKLKHKIRNAYDAFWFLHDHPKLNVQERTRILPEQADEMEKQGFLVTRDTGGKCYRIWRHVWRHALTTNLDIFYTKTNKPGSMGRIDDDEKKNKYVACWLEFGPLSYGYAYSGGKEPSDDWDGETTLVQMHDYKLDCGGGTFDEALIHLAKNVIKQYGDYPVKESRKRFCGKPVCADCKECQKFSKSLTSRVCVP